MDHQAIRQVCTPLTALPPSPHCKGPTHREKHHPDHPQPASPVQLLHTQHGMKASVLRPTEGRVMSSACYLLCGYLGLRGDSLPQPGHCPSHGHGHPNAHAVRALALVHHGDVQRPVERTESCWGCAECLGLGSPCQASQGAAGLPEATGTPVSPARGHPGCLRPQVPPQHPRSTHTRVMLSCSWTNTFDFQRLLSHNIDWSYLFPQAQRLSKKAPFKI